MLDLVYPPRCLVCERANQPDLCEACVRSFLPVAEPICPVCGRPVSPASGCRVCAQKLPGGWAFDAARGAAIYHGALRHAVHLLKYRNAISLGPLLGAFLANRLVVDGLLPITMDVVVPVPLSPRRFHQRGYNQSELLAQPVAALLHLPLLPHALRRTADTTSQTLLFQNERKRNVAHAFVVSEPEQIADKRILLVDDVFTTGATVDACAHALREAGASLVVVATLAAGA